MLLHDFVKTLPTKAAFRGREGLKTALIIMVVVVLDVRRSKAALFRKLVTISNSCSMDYSASHNVGVGFLKG